VCGALDVRALDLLDALQLETFGANLEAVNDIEKGFPVLALQVHEARVVVGVALGT
jgi:hypothetical protein